MTPIISVWQRLPRLRRLAFTAEAGAVSLTHWCGHGAAKITVTQAQDVVRLYEDGHFTPISQTGAQPFRNVYRWVLMDDHLALAHERFGVGGAVPLVNLVAQDETTLAATAPHVCGADRYDARLLLTPNSLILNWHITGPRKDEHLRYCYR